MRFLVRIWLALAACLASGVAPLRLGATIINGNFATGSVAPWTVTTIYDASTAGLLTPAVAVSTPGPAPFTNNNLNMVYVGNYSCALFSGAGDVGHYDTAAISQPTYIDPTATRLAFEVAAVLNGAHAGTPSYDAYFEIQVMNSAGTVVVDQQYFYDASPAPLVDDGVPQWKHMPWTSVVFDLTAYAGTTVTVQFDTHDCYPGGHFDYAYVDGFELIPSPCPTPTYTNSPTFTVSPTYTPSPTATRTFTISPTFTVSPTITQTLTPVDYNDILSAIGLYPNPFQDQMQIAYVLQIASSLRLTIYNVAGELICTQTQAAVSPGVGRFIWTGANNYGARCASGVYLLHVETVDSSATAGFWAKAAIAR